MILHFDVTEFIPYVPIDHKDINDKRLYVFDKRKLNSKNYVELFRNPDNEVTLYKILHDGHIHDELKETLKVSLVKPALTSIRNINGQVFNVIFE